MASIDQDIHETYFTLMLNEDAKRCKHAGGSEVIFLPLSLNIVLQIKIPEERLYSTTG